MCKEITEKVKSWYCKESSRTRTLSFTVWVFHQNELGKNCSRVCPAKVDRIVVRNSHNKSNNNDNNGDVLEACSRLQSFSLSLVALCASCDNSNNNNNINLMMIMID